jgi:hypothetical protein
MKNITKNRNVGSVAEAYNSFLCLVTLFIIVLTITKRATYILRYQAVGALGWWSAVVLLIPAW